MYKGQIQRNWTILAIFQTPRSSQRRKGGGMTVSKVSHVLEFIKKTFQELYNPGKNLSADEGMISYKDRISSKQ